jgi:hypothetical protein
MNPADLAQPIRLCACATEPLVHCIVHPLTPHGCEHIESLLETTELSYAALLRRLPVLSLEDQCWRMRVCPPDDGAAVPYTAKTLGGGAPMWAVAVRYHLGRMETLTALSGCEN